MEAGRREIDAREEKALEHLVAPAGIACVHPTELVEQEHLGACERHLAGGNRLRDPVVDRHGCEPRGQADAHGGVRLQPHDEEVGYQGRPRLGRSAAHQPHDCGCSVSPFQRSTGFRTTGLNGRATFCPVRAEAYAA